MLQLLCDMMSHMVSPALHGVPIATPHGILLATFCDIGFCTFALSIVGYRGLSDVQGPVRCTGACPMYLAHLCELAPLIGHDFHGQGADMGLDAKGRDQGQS